MESIRLNNLASSLLSTGIKEDTALIYFQNALATLRDTVNSEEIGFSQHHPQRSPPTTKTDSCPACIELSAVSDGNFAKGETTSVEGAFEFYDKVFVVTLGGNVSVCCTREVEKLQNILLAAITYNLGSVSHRMGIQTGKSSQFARAMRFYELSFSTVENVLQDFGFDSNLVLLLCSLYNNMGHIYARSYDVQETKFCLEWMQKTVNAEEFCSCTCMCDEDYCFFSQYLMFVAPEEQFSSAPAA